MDPGSRSTRHPPPTPPAPPDPDRQQPTPGPDPRSPGAPGTLDPLARLTRRLLSASACVVTVVEDGRPVIVGRAGPAGQGEPPAELLERTLASPAPLTIEDARADPRPRSRASTGEPGFVAYAGVPIVTRAGRTLGALGVTDERSRAWTEADASLLRELAACAAGELELRRELAERERSERAAGERAERFRRLLDDSRDANERLEAEVHRRTARLHEAQRIAHLGHWELTPATGEVYWSAETFRILGLAPGSVAPSLEAYLDFVPPGKRGRVRESVDAAARDGGAFELEHPLVRPSGEERIVHVRGEALHTPDAPVRVIGTVHDVTERRALEAALAANARRFRALIEQTQEIISILAVDGTATYHSPGVERVLGFASEALAGRNAFELVHPDDRERVVAAFERVIEEAEPVTVEYRYRHRQGGYRVVRSTGTNLLAEPAVAGIVVNSQDVTETRRAEERLRQAEKMEAVGQLAGGIAHDFNNVLHIIKSRAAIARMDLSPESPVYEDVEEIDQAVNRAANLTRQLLAFSRKQVLRPQVLDLNRSVADIEKMLRRTLGEDIEVVTRLAPDLGRVRADPGQVEQVLLNLAVNARDAMPTGGRLVMETANTEITGSDAGSFPFRVRPGRYVALSVSDSGSGMSPDVRAHIFEPFFTTKPPGKGTGMGLSTVYGIVKQSGGYVWARSEEGEGTTFEIHLPRVDEEPEATEGTDAPGARAAYPRATILLVEDEAAVRESARRMLQRLGHTVLAASDGVEALRVAAAYPGPIDLVLTDVVMPRMGGRALVERLRAERPELRVVYTSGYTDEAVVRHGIVEGSVAFLQKPYAPAVLAGKIAEVLTTPARRRP